MKKSSIATLVMLFLLIPAALYFGDRLPGKGYYLTGTLMTVFALVPFFLSFEHRKPQARELTVIAVLCAIAVASRLAFAWIPNFKPIFAVIMIAGFAFGQESGFLVGAVSAFASNLFFGQGLYTPWQMLAFGVAGLVAGLLRKQKALLEKPWAMGLTGFFTVFLAVGPLLDTCSVFLAANELNAKAVLGIYMAGVPVNLSQSVCTFLTLLLVGKPFLEKLDRIRVKYGMMEAENGL